MTARVCLCKEPFEESEEKWLSSMESSRWLEYVRYVQILRCHQHSRFGSLSFGGLTALLSCTEFNFEKYTEEFASWPSACHLMYTLC